MKKLFTLALALFLTGFTIQANMFGGLFKDHTSNQTATVENETSHNLIIQKATQTKRPGGIFGVHGDPIGTFPQQSIYQPSKQKTVEPGSTITVTAKGLSDPSWRIYNVLQGSKVVATFTTKINTHTVISQDSSGNFKTSTRTQGKRSPIVYGPINKTPVGTGWPGYQPKYPWNKIA